MYTDVLLSLALVAAFVVAVVVSLEPPAPLRRLVAAHSLPHPGAKDWTDGTIWSLSTVRDRLFALSGELDRLDRDTTQFARAFRVMVVQDAYRALLADEARLAAVPALDLGPVRPVEPDRDDEGPGGRGRSEGVELVLEDGDDSPLAGRAKREVLRF